MTSIGSMRQCGEGCEQAVNNLEQLRFDSGTPVPIILLNAKASIAGNCRAVAT